MLSYRVPAGEPEPEELFLAIAAFVDPSASPAEHLKAARRWAEESRRQGYPRCRICGAKTYEPCDAGLHG